MLFCFVAILQARVIPQYFCSKSQQSDELAHETWFPIEPQTKNVFRREHTNIDEDSFGLVIEHIMRQRFFRIKRRETTHRTHKTYTKVIISKAMATDKVPQQEKSNKKKLDFKQKFKTQNILLGKQIELNEKADENNRLFNSKNP